MERAETDNSAHLLSLHKYVNLNLNWYYAPKTFKTPAPDREFVKKRNGVTAFDCRQQSAVCRIQALVAASAVSGVRNAVARFIYFIGIARIDASEIGQKRNQSLVFLVNSVARAMSVVHLSPRINGSEDKAVFRRKFGVC